MKTIIHRLILTNYLVDPLESGVYNNSADAMHEASSSAKVVRNAKASALLVGSVIALISSFSLSSCSTPKQDSIPALSQEALIARGKYVVTVSSCHDCHTPKIMTPHGPILDSTRLLSGHPQGDPIATAVRTNDWVLFGNDLTSAVGPWGMSFSANLTPDDTGIGSWSFEQFKTAIKKGKYKGLEGSRNLLPPMPWEMYRNFTDEDLLAIFTYLQSLKPINNLVPPPIGPDDLASK